MDTMTAAMTLDAGLLRTAGPALSRHPATR